MNETYLYDIDSTVWTINSDTDIIESWKVVQVVISAVTGAANKISYILHGRRGSMSFAEADVYPTLDAALETL